MTPVAKVRQAVMMTVSPSCRQLQSPEKGSLLVSWRGDTSWLPISDEDEGRRWRRADFRKESGSLWAAGRKQVLVIEQHGALIAVFTQC